ncbi:MAG: hypothetical protein ACXWKT_04335 [Caulobacteraceae bacterium]
MAPRAPLKMADVEQLLAVHWERGLRLSPADDKDLSVHSDGDPIGLVTEVLRLAHVGAFVESHHHDASAVALMEGAARLWPGRR